MILFVGEVFNIAGKSFIKADNEMISRVKLFFSHGF